ncbi:hypothetical protein EBT25_10230 [bacterium]|jgi:hypothetical protein|nr:hypothetical protein [bacterium]
MEPESNKIEIWPSYWPSKSRMTKSDFEAIIKRYEALPRIVNGDDLGKLIQLVKQLVIEIGFLEKVVEEYERSEVKF